MLRLPRSLVDVEAMKPYCRGEGATLRAKGDYVLLEFFSDEEGGDWDEAGEGWLASLIPLRAALLAGDLRPLYLAWLYDAGREEFDDEEPEPPVPPGLRKLTAAQRRFAEFMRIDEHLIDAAAQASTGEGPAGPSRAELTAWLASVPAAEKDALLLQLMEGEGGHLGIQLLRRYQQERAERTKASRRGPAEEAPRRSVGELLDAARRAAEEAERRRREDKARKDAAAARKAAELRERHLQALAPRAEKLWGEVEKLIATKHPNKYDEAVTLLGDLYELAERGGKENEATGRIRALRERHAAKRTFIQRLDRAGLPK
jgi:hypothetical protein